MIRLSSLATALTAARTPVDVAEAVVKQGVLAIGARTAVFAVPSGNGGLEIAAQEGTPEAMTEPYRRVAPDANLPAIKAYRSGQAEWVESGDEYAHLYPNVHPYITGVQSAVTLPLSLEGHVVAVVAFRFAEKRVFPPEERALLLTFAMQAAVALERAQLYVEEVALRKRLEALADLTSRLSIAMTRDEVATIVVDIGMATAVADTCMLFTCNEDDGALELVADRGIAPTIVSSLQRIPLDSGNPVLVTVLERRAVWAESVAEYHAFQPDIAALQIDAPRASAFWCLPMVSEGRVIGVLSMGYYAERRFPIEERRFVETFTRQCAEALRRSQRLEAEQRARRAAESLQASLDTMVRSIADAVIATDAEGRIILMNAIAERLTGHREDDVKGRPLREAFHAIDEKTREPIESPVERVLRSHAPAPIRSSTLLVSKSGQETAIEESGAPIRRDGPGGNRDVRDNPDAPFDVEGVVLVFRDVTDKKREEARRDFLAAATAALTESLEYERTLAKVTQLAVPMIADWCAVDMVDDDKPVHRRLAVAHVDPAKVAFALEFGQKYPPNPDSKTGVPSVIRTGQSEMYPVVTDAMVAATAIDEEHLRMTRALGLRSVMIVPLKAHARTLGAMTFVASESGRTFTASDLGFAEELARRCSTAIENARLYAGEQRARQVADVANRAKDEFLATVSHELRTPLNAILGWSKLIAAADLDESKRVRAVETIGRNAVAMGQLIEDLLDVSRMISGKMRLDVQSVDIPRLIETTVESIRPAADAKGIRLVATADEVTGTLLGDAARLQQVVWNLLSNAVKFTPERGEIVLCATRVRRSVEISVTDSGRGIAPEFLPYVFDPFRQETTTQERTRGGLGLGLAIAQQIVELHGGKLEATSRGAGHGATFTVRLPSAVSTPSNERDTSTARRIRVESSFERPPALNGLRVLVVDDDEDARHLARAVLEECGSLVTTADGVDAALDLLARTPTDLLISDIGMPEKDGYELIRRVRALPAASGGNLPAVALTAYARADDRRRVMNAGFAMHIAKPIEPAELIAVVANIARQSRHSQPPST